MKKNYMFCMDIKTMLQHDALPKTGRCYRGTLTMVNDYLCRFVEMVPIRPIRRNPKIFDGRLITVTQQKDGSLRFNFKPVRLSEEFTANDYAVGVAREIKEALGAW